MHAQRPFHRSYWAIPGKLLAGCYPGDLDPARMDQKLKSLVHAGVTVVVSLMEESECDHAGKPFFDYAPQLHQSAKEIGRSIVVQRFPIRDQSIPTPGQMETILDTIEREISAGGTVYVHCWGGKGRTATVVGCLMIRHRLETPQSVIEKLRQLTSHASEFFWPTPQTEEQSAFVTNWRPGHE